MKSRPMQTRNVEQFELYFLDGALDGLGGWTRAVGPFAPAEWTGSGLYVFSEVFLFDEPSCDSILPVAKSNGLTVGWGPTSLNPVWSSSSSCVEK